MSHLNYVQVSKQRDKVSGEGQLNNALHVYRNKYIAYWT